MFSELDKTLPVTGLAMLGEDPQPFHVRVSPGLLRNVPALEEAAAGRGLLTIRPERDGIVRRVPMIMLAQGDDHAVAEFRNAAGGDRHRHDPHQIRQGRHQEHRRQGFEIPTDRNGQLWVHFARHDPSIYVSATDVLDGQRPARQDQRASWC